MVEHLSVILLLEVTQLAHKAAGHFTTISISCLNSKVGLHNWLGLQKNILDYILATDGEKCIIISESILIVKF
jgi:hypothetical protein